VKISEVHSQLREVYIDWSRYIIDPQYARSTTDVGPCITWTGRAPIFLDHPVMASQIASLLAERQFTFRVYEDDSIFQIFYSFSRDGATLQTARLAFYSAIPDDKILSAYNLAYNLGESVDTDTISNIEHELEDEEGPFELDRESEFDAQLLGLTDGPVSWLRIEYDPQASKGLLHHDCHLHLSTFPHSRFVVAGVPGPSTTVVSMIE
jgi:hypothetical protein